MTDTTIDVRLRAQTDELRPGMDQAAKTVQQASATMRDALGEAMTRIGEVLRNTKELMGGVMDGMRTELASHTDAMKSKLVEMSGSFGEFGALLMRLPGPLMAVGVALTAVFAGSKFAQATAKMTEDALDMGRALGITATQARVYRAAIDDVGGSQSEFINLAEGMSRKLREDEDGLKDMGLATRDAAGNLRPLNELVVDGIGILNTYKEGTDRGLASQDLFGRSLDSSSKLLKVNNGVLEANREHVEALGLEVGERSVAAFQDFNDANHLASLSLQGITKAIGDALMPVMTDLINLFSSVAPAAIVVIKGALGGLLTAFYGLKNGVVVVWNTINAMVVSVAEPIRAVTEAMGRALMGDFAGAAAAIGGIGGVIKGAWSNAMDNMVASSEKTASRISALFSKDKKVGDHDGIKGTGDYVEKADDKPGKKGKAKRAPKAPKEPKEPSHMQTYEAALAERRLAYAKENGLREMSKADELAYWKELLETYQVGSKDRAAILIKMSRLELDVMRQRAKEGRELSKLDIEEAKADAVQHLRLAEMDAKEQHVMGFTTKQQLLEQQRAFERERYDIEYDALIARIELAASDPNSNPVERQRLDNQLLELKRNFEMKKREIESQIRQEAAAPELNVFRNMEQSFRGAIAGMLSGAQTLRQGLSNIFKGIFGTFADEMVAKPLAQMAMRYVRETAIYKAIFATQVGLQGTAAAMTGAIKDQETVRNVMANATQASSAAAASQAGIPIVGPALAIAAAGAMLGFVMGMLGGGGDKTTTSVTRIPSAAGGFDIPAGLNPLTQLHEREMVLPAQHADTIRNLGNQGGGAPVTVTLNATPMPGNFFMVHRNDLEKALKEMRRDGVKLS